ncbi:MAG: hypothetical protein LC720_03100, partial [Actinobacteria bacterium]|nr:hypothetical protein [Actinomycetota bacterium]
MTLLTRLMAAEHQRELLAVARVAHRRAPRRRLLRRACATDVDPRRVPPSPSKGELQPSAFP